MINRKIYIEIKNIGNYFLQAEDVKTFLSSEESISIRISDIIKKLLPIGEARAIIISDLDSEDFLFLRTELNLLIILFKGINSLPVEDLSADISLLHKATENIKVKKILIDDAEVWNDTTGIIKKK